MKDERVEWLGSRFFKYDMQNRDVLQVCFGSGEPRRGKGNNIGIYYIHNTTFLTNYFGPGYIEPIEQAQYEEKLSMMVAALTDKN